MNHNKLGPFLNAVFELATKHCGTEFEQKVTEQRITREKFLQSLWSEDKDMAGSDTELVFREIDFDTIVNFAIEYLDDKKFAKLLYALGDLALRYGQLDKARDVFKRILHNHSNSVTTAFIGSVHQMLGDVALYQSDLDEAHAYYKMARDIHLEDGDELRYAGALNAVGVIHAEQGNTQASQICFKDAHRIAQNLNNNDLVIQTSMNLANLSHTLGNYQESLMHLVSTKGLIPASDIEMLAKVNHNLGIAHKAMHHTEKSIKCFDEAITMAESSEDYYLRTLSFLEKSEVLSSIGEVKEGSALLTTAFQAFSEFGDRLGMADAYKIFGKISSQRDADTLATAFFQNSLNISERMNNKLGSAETYTAMGEHFEQNDDTNKAMESYLSAKKNFESMEAHTRVAEINSLLNKLNT